MTYLDYCLNVLESTFHKTSKGTFYRVAKNSTNYPFYVFHSDGERSSVYIEKLCSDRDLCLSIKNCDIVIKHIEAPSLILNLTDCTLQCADYTVINFRTCKMDLTNTRVYISRFDGEYIAVDALQSYINDKRYDCSLRICPGIEIYEQWRACENTPVELRCACEMSEDICLLCQDSYSECVNFPCGHSVVCANCIDEWASTIYSKQCQQCKCNVDKILVHVL